MEILCLAHLAARLAVEELHQVPMDRRFETKGNVALIQPVWKG